MSAKWINASLALVSALAISGCATPKHAVLPAGATMLEIWNQQTGAGAMTSVVSRQLLDARASLRRPLPATGQADGDERNDAYTRSASAEIHSQFPRLPNPDLVMYVFAHLSGVNDVPIPAYSTVFPLYQRVQYALPGERTEDY